MITSTPTGAITIAAPAKINLSLHVCGKRADGYHLLDSLVVFAGVGDRITVTPPETSADSITLKITGPFGAALANEPDNLVLRAARLLAAKHGITRGADITLEKNLPVASGIGGGSADAAATLTACGKLWGVDAQALDDREIAASLGADVPVCLRGIPAFMSGIGEIVEPAPTLPAAWLVLVNPGEPLSTKDVFKALNGRFSAPMAREGLRNLPDAKALTDVLSHFHNDLMMPAKELLASVNTVLETLAAMPGCLLARLSGSGPTCFGVFADDAAAANAVAQIGAGHPKWWAASAPMLR